MAEKGGGFDVEKIAGHLIYVERARSRYAITYGGWKRELLVDEIVSAGEEQLLICTLCKGVLRDAMAVNISQKKLPRCNACCPSTYCYSERAELIRGVINERTVHCPLISEHCKWRGPVTKLLPHLKNCEFLPIPCPQGCSASAVYRNSGFTVPSNLFQKIPRNKLEYHLANICSMRIIQCEYCLSKTQACQINSHILICEEYPIECPNKCFLPSSFGSNVSEVYKNKRKNIKNHLHTDCPLQQVVCPYSIYGCGAVVCRKDMEQHKLAQVSMQQHLAMVEARLREYTTVDPEDIVTPFSRPTSPEPSNSKTLGGIEWKIFDYKMRMCRNVESRSPPFYSSGYKLRFYLTLVPEDTVGIYFEVLAGDHDPQLEWPLSCEITIKIVNPKREDKDLVKVVGSDYFRDQNAFARPKPHKPNVPFCCELIPMDQIKPRGLSHNGSLLFRVFIRCY